MVLLSRSSCCRRGLRFKKPGNFFVPPFTTTNHAYLLQRQFSAPIKVDQQDEQNDTQPSAAKTLAELSKARLSALVVFTTSAGYLAAGGPVDPVTFSAACVGTSLAAASASTFNQVIEIKNDSMMKRTCNRPLPSGRISKSNAIKWGLSTAGVSGAILAAGTDPVTTALGLSNIFLYSVPYTLSKTRTEANTWIGSVVGAIPPMMGWTAATGGDLASADPWLLGALLFYWQFPHFLALSWMYRKDYARGGFAMIPCADPDGARTAALIRRYALYLAALPVGAAAAGVTGSMFAVEGLALNAYCLRLAQRFHRERSNENARRVFRASLWYLPALLSLFVLHSRRWGGLEEEEAAAARVAEGAPLAALVRRVRRAGAGLCAHEQAIVELKRPGLCPPVAAEGARDGAAVAVGEAAAAAREGST